MSNLLDKASIILTPTAYSEGVVHTVKPDDSRGENLIKYSEDFSQSYWNKITSTVTGGFPSPDGENNSYRFLTSAASNSYLYVTGLEGIIASNSYTVSAWVKCNNNGLDDFRLYTTTGGTSSDFTATSEWKRFEFTFVASSTSTNIGFRASSSNNTDIE